MQLLVRLTPLGPPQAVAGDDTVAVSAAFDHRTLKRLRDTRGDAARRSPPARQLTEGAVASLHLRADDLRFALDAEICIAAHAIVARDRPPEMRALLEDLLRRVAGRLAVCEAS